MKMFKKITVFLLISSLVFLVVSCSKKENVKIDELTTDSKIYIPLENSKARAISLDDSIGSVLIEGNEVIIHAKKEGNTIIKIIYDDHIVEIPIIVKPKPKTNNQNKPNNNPGTSNPPIINKDGTIPIIHARNTPVGNEVIIKGYNLGEANNNLFIIQDETAGIALYIDLNDPNKNKILNILNNTIGKTIKIKGIRDNFHNLYRVKNLEVEESKDIVKSPSSQIIDTIDNKSLNMFQGSLVSCYSLTFKGIDKKKYDTIEVKFSKDNNDTILYFDNRLFSKYPNLKRKIDNLKIGFKYDLVNFAVGIFEENNQFLPLPISEIYDGNSNPSKPDEVNIFLNLNGGSGISKLRYIIKKGNKFTMPTNPIKQNYEFLYWSDKENGTKFNFNNPINNNIILYAVWKYIGGGSITPSNDPYYSNVKATEGDELYSQIKEAISNVNPKSYDYAKEVLVKSDESLKYPGKLYLLGEEDNGRYDNVWGSGGKPWNRGHIWAQSKLGKDSVIRCDVHNLRAEDSSGNSSHGNDCWSEDSNDPGKYHRGDVARIMLYMATRWGDKLTLTKYIGKTSGKSYKMGDIRLFLRWHQDDPVDDFEIKRNNIIYKMQGNRNPFIDNPSWFEPMWIYFMRKENLTISNIKSYEYAINTYKEIINNYVEIEPIDENIYYI